jgi:putative effector of murein hydrolase LrgA (UPF0299 family)
MENLALYKMKLAVLWLVFGFGAFAIPAMELYVPGSVEGLIAGEIAGSQITPEFILGHAIGILLPPVMAVLSLTLKDSTNRWLNIIVGIVFAGIALLFGPIDYLSRQSAYLAYLIPIGIVQFAAAALIVWYAWKSKQKA